MDHEYYEDEYILAILKSVKTIAMVGASSNKTRPSYFVLKYLLEKGYEVIPVNPGHAGKEFLGQEVYASLSDIPQPVDMVDIFRNAAAAGPITDEAIKIGANTIWMQLGVRNDEAAEKAGKAGLRIVMDRCPKIEYGRLSGEIGWMGVNSRTISSKRGRLSGGRMQSLRIDKTSDS